MIEKKLKPRKPKAAESKKAKAEKKPKAEKMLVPTKTLSLEIERPVLELVADFAEMRGLGLDAAINKVLNTGIVRLAALAKYAAKK